MSNIPRYRPVANDKYGITDDVDGKLCEYRDYARLKAEVERLTKAHSDALADFWAIHKGYFDLKAEVERLRASSFVTAVPVEQYERLIKAGDGLHAFLINYIVDSRISSAYLNKLDDGWTTAKEGKQP